LRKFLNINLDNQEIRVEELHGEVIAWAGRYLIARTLLEGGIATVDPLSPGNPLIFSAGPFAGTNLSNANRLSVGCKSPLTGGVKEANAGGTFALALGHLEMAGFTLHGAAREWVVIRITKDGAIGFDSAEPYMGRGNIETAALLHKKYGRKVSLALCGPVGEYQGLLSGIAFSDPDGRPVRLAARGGVGAVMGSKKVKAIVIDKHRMPPLHDRKKVMGSIRRYGSLLGEQIGIQTLKQLGTAYVADLANYIGGLPVRNFSDGRLIDTDVEPLKIGGDYIRNLNLERGGDPSHACMPGCMIKCSNVLADANGEEIVSPLEYETIGLMGSNCGLTDPDDVARLNAIANDLGIDTIETGAMLGVLMDSGEAPFGDVEFMVRALEDIRRGTERGRLLAKGTARVGEHFGNTRLPVIKKQAISAYDPRIMEMTGISMMVTAQGADHTTGNIAGLVAIDKPVEELAADSFDLQVRCAAADSLGLCVFGRSVTDVNLEMIAEAINDAHGTNLESTFFRSLGLETLRLERRFNVAAGFTEADDELPEFLLSEPLAPTGRTARLHGRELHRFMGKRMEEGTGGG
jgi:aldehyde:ferredoxin oxidoreductase